MSTSSHPQFGDEQIQAIRARFTRFRILVVGRANAGKTTILRKLCNATGEPTIFDPNGQKIDPSTLEASSMRGKHDIENQMIFEGNPGFIFHDSCGFESGHAEELDVVRTFIEQRSRTRSVNEQLHAIWYVDPSNFLKQRTTLWFV
jgi:GTP-binding protein EngB required for normal cell division